MNLKPSETAAILAGKHPQIVRPDEVFEKGEEIVLKTTGTINGQIPQVSITVTGHKRHKNGAWEAIYTVKDERGVYVNQGLGYTRSPSRALDPEAPVLDKETIERHAMEAAQSSALLKGEIRVRKKGKRAEARAGRGKGPLEGQFASRQHRRTEGQP